jgi:hypothetical protein
MQVREEQARDLLEWHACFHHALQGAPTGVEEEVFIAGFDHSADAELLQTYRRATARSEQNDL